MTTKSKYAPYEGTFHEELDKEIVIEELQDALDKSKTGRAAGPDGCSHTYRPQRSHPSPSRPRSNHHLYGTSPTLYSWTTPFSRQDRS
jgi:hypothetical protein